MEEIKVEPDEREVMLSIMSIAISLKRIADAMEKKPEEKSMFEQVFGKN